MIVLQFYSRFLDASATLTLHEDRVVPVSDVAAPIVAQSVLQEDRRYWYELDGPAPQSNVRAEVISDGRVVRERPSKPNSGLIDTKSQAGFLTISVKFSREADGDRVDQSIEIVPTKFDPESFRLMVDDVADRCLELALRFVSPVSVPLRSALTATSAGLQQRFFFLRALLADDNFRVALARIVASPHLGIDAEQTESALSRTRSGRAIGRAIASGSRRVRVPDQHPLAHLGSLPRTAMSAQRFQTADTAENRFVKFVLGEFVAELANISLRCRAFGTPPFRRVAADAEEIEQDLRRVLGHAFFSEVGTASVVPLGSPVLQRRGGYRDVLNAWLRFQMGASLEWDGADDLFAGGKRDTDRIYEYWLFFQLLDVLERELGVPAPTSERFLAASTEGLVFRLRAGRAFVHEGRINGSFGRPLRVRFSYNRFFGCHEDEGLEGSWSFPMRPDYTISFWPDAVPPEVAERMGLAVHVHFDCKYRIEKLPPMTVSHDQLHELKEEERRGNYRRADILVAHAYRDAVRRSGGAYILYPGTDKAPELRRRYHELLPGVGAFAVRPTRTGEALSGIEAVGSFLAGVASHLSNRLSMRERLSYSEWSLGQEAAPPDLPTPWLDAAETAGEVRLRPAPSCVLVAEPSLPERWICQHGVFPLLLSGGNVDRDLARVDAVVLSIDASVCLVPTSGGPLRIVTSEELDSPGFEPVKGHYLLLPITLGDAHYLQFNEHVMPNSLGAIAAAKGALAVSMNDVLKHARVLPRA